MSPELERLLEALYEKLTCPPEEKSHRVATFERLHQDALARRHGTSRDELLSAFHEPYLSSSSSFSSSSSIRWPGFEDEDEQEDDLVHGPNACEKAKGASP